MITEIVRIPEYTADQFYDTTEPYEFLYQYKENKFLLKQMVQKMKARAGAVGVKCFIALWDAYQEMQAQKNGVMLANSTQFDGQEIELFSGEYICDETGVYVTDKYGYEQTICRHPIMPVERLVNIDSGEERLKIAYKKGRIWRHIIVEKSVIASSSSILQLAANGIMVNSENAKALSTYILEMEQLNYELIPEQKSVGRLGWVGNHGFSPYVDDLVFDGENNFKHIFNAVKSEGSREAWLYAMQDLRKEKAFGRIFLAASFASAILEPCGLLPFFLHAWGGTEVGKTVGLMIAASVWACPKMGEYITTFNSTLVGQEMTATFLNSLPLCMDELQIQSSAGVKDFDRIIYQLTEGVGRTRGAKTGGLQKINTWKNCIITNGEHPISNSNSGGGAVNRVIEFECHEKVYSDLVGLCAVIQSNYGFAGREFVEYLQSDGAFDRVNALQKEYYRELLKSDSTDKQAASASAILAADHIATELIFKDGNNLTVADLEKIMTKKKEVNVNNRALEFIYELVERNPNRFKANEFGDYQGEVWGKIDDECIYIIKSVFDREMGNSGYNSTAFLAWAKRNNATITDSGKRTKKARITGSATNCVCIRKNLTENEQTEMDEYDDLPL
jgi:uncharacterized protein (DUF927 family)